MPRPIRGAVQLPFFFKGNVGNIVLNDASAHDMTALGKTVEGGRETNSRKLKLEKLLAEEISSTSALSSIVNGVQRCDADGLE